MLQSALQCRCREALGAKGGRGVEDGRYAMAFYAANVALGNLYWAACLLPRTFDLLSWHMAFLVLQVWMGVCFIRTARLDPGTVRGPDSTAAYDSAVDAVARTGAIAPLCTLVREGAQETKETCAAALWALSTDNAPNKATIAKLGGIEPLVSMLISGTTPESSSNAAGALSSLELCHFYAESESLQIACGGLSAAPPCSLRKKKQMMYQAYLQCLHTQRNRYVRSLFLRETYHRHSPSHLDK